MSKSFVLPLALSLALVLASCGRKPDPVGPTTSLPEQLVGTWTIQSVKLDGVETPLAEAFGWGPNTVSSRMTIEENGNYSGREFNGTGAAVYTETGLVSVNEKNISITIETADGKALTPPEGKTGQWEVAKNDGGESYLTLTISDGGQLSEIIYVKSI